MATAEKKRRAAKVQDAEESVETMDAAESPAEQTESAVEDRPNQIQPAPSFYVRVLHDCHWAGRQRHVGEIVVCSRVQWQSVKPHDLYLERV